MSIRRLLASAAWAAAVAAETPKAAAAQRTAPSRLPARLELVAQFAHQVTGVAVAPDGRVFVNFPRWTEDAPVSVAELRPDGSLRPYPNAGWNAWRNAAPASAPPLDAATHWVCVQSVVADDRGSLWVLDPGAPAIGTLVPGAPKLVEINLARNAVVRTVRFDTAAAPQGSYLNDVRFSPDGSTAYLSDAGARGALVVVDLASGRSRRVLDGHPSTQAEPGLVVRAGGRALWRPDGRAAVFNVDGIALTRDGAYLYYQALNGRTMYRIATAALRQAVGGDASFGADGLAERVERVGPSEPTDGLWMDRAGRIFLTAFQDDAVKVRSADGAITTLVRDARLRWPDSMAEGPDGALYVTASHIHDMPWFAADAPASVATTLWRVPGALSGPPSGTPAR